VGKTNLMTKYADSRFDEVIALRNPEIMFSIWNLGGQSEFISMLPLACNDAVVVQFMFSLVHKAMLTSIKERYRQVRSINKGALCAADACDDRA
jgi:GTP-binding protein of the ras superfamily involved in termination of M-phase